MSKYLVMELGGHIERLAKEWDEAREAFEENETVGLLYEYDAARDRLAEALLEAFDLEDVVEAPPGAQLTIAWFYGAAQVMKGGT